MTNGVSGSKLKGLSCDAFLQQQMELQNKMGMPGNIGRLNFNDKIEKLKVKQNVNAKNNWNARQNENTKQNGMLEKIGIPKKFGII